MIVNIMHSFVWLSVLYRFASPTKVQLSNDFGGEGLALKGKAIDGEAIQSPPNRQIVLLANFQSLSSP